MLLHYTYTSVHDVLGKAKVACPPLYLEHVHNVTKVRGTRMHAHACMGHITHATVHQLRGSVGAELAQSPKGLPGACTHRVMRTGMFAFSPREHPVAVHACDEHTADPAGSRLHGIDGSACLSLPLLIPISTGRSWRNASCSSSTGWRTGYVVWGNMQHGRPSSML